MSLCSKNYSVGVYDRPSNYIINMQRNKITGILGSHLDRLLIKNERLCNFYSVYDFGEKLSNNSYPTHTAMNLIENGIIDLYSRPETMFLFPNDEKFIDITQPVRSEPFQVGQFLKEAQSSKTTSIDFLTQNFNLIYLILFGYLITMIFSLAFNLINYQFSITKLKKNLFKLISLDNSVNNKFIIIFFNIFIFILFTILINLIKTEKVVVDTSEIINSESQFNRTNKIACWMEKQYDFTLAKNAPKETFLYRIYSEKTFKKEIKHPDGSLTRFCLMDDDLDLDRIKIHLNLGLHNYFLFFSKTVLLLVVTYITTNLKDLIFFNNDINYFEQLLVHYIPKHFEDLNRKKYLKSKLTDYYEKGFYVDIFNKFHNGLNEFVGKSAKVYSSVENYIEDHTKIENIKLNYFENLFIYLITIELIIFFIFIIDKLMLPKIKNLLNNNCIENND